MLKLVIDLEMNGKTYINGEKINEIIQIGAVLLNNNNEKISEFKRYVTPQYSKLSNYIKNLTGITEENLEEGTHIGRALVDLEYYIKSQMNIARDYEVMLYEWSDSDSIAILKEMGAEEIENEFIKNLSENFIDLQKQYSAKLGLERRINLEKALELIGIDMDGQAHDALVDADNTANLLIAIEDNDKVKELIASINEMLSDKPVLSTSLGSMFNLSEMLSS